jgi:hypothetical protein
MELVILNFVVDIFIVIVFSLSIHFIKSIKRKSWHPINDKHISEEIDLDNQKTYCIQFHFSKKAIFALDKLKSDIKAKDYANTIREAVSYYMWFIGTQKAGNKIIVENKFGERKRIKLKLTSNQ